ncbi:hypothetical protein L916_12829 [Phytophthora nicotianae]|uniref:Uncharacterized protein n=2 Tax=Phytophthora nicotianae TaxID=4792 RepID=W2IL83_PHYNI|nr:hypothetical protein L916_12829 [Phytophthora nicotianae]
MLRNHNEYPFSVEAGAQRKNRVQRRIETHDDNTAIRGVTDDRTPSADKPKPKKQRTLEVSIAMGSDKQPASPNISCS